jgi:hypothetical protein
MDSLCSRLKQFQTENESWNVYDFYDIQNKELKNSVLNIIKAEKELIDPLLKNGDETAVNNLYEMIQLDAHHMAMITFSCLLEQLFLREELGKKFSKEMVLWYRKKGWKFPEFYFEKDTRIECKLDEIEDNVNQVQTKVEK